MLRRRKILKSEATGGGVEGVTKQEAKKIHTFTLQLCVRPYS